MGKLGSGANNLKGYRPKEKTVKVDESQSTSKGVDESQKTSKQVTVRLPIDLYYYYSELAKDNSSTLAGEIKRALAFYRRKHPQ